MIYISFYILSSKYCFIFIFYNQSIILFIHFYIMYFIYFDTISSIPNFIMIIINHYIFAFLYFIINILCYIIFTTSWCLYNMYHDVIAFWCEVSIHHDVLSSLSLFNKRCCIYNFVSIHHDINEVLMSI